MDSYMPCNAMAHSTKWYIRLMRVPRQAWTWLKSEIEQFPDMDGRDQNSVQGTTAIPCSNLSNAIYKIHDDHNMNGTFTDSKSSHWICENIWVDQVLTIDGYLISCSAVFIWELKGAKQGLFSHMFFPLTVDHSYLSNQLGIKSIMHHGQHHDQGSSLIIISWQWHTPLLTDLISNLENYSNVTVATLAIPKFEKFSVPRYGYKTFGLLSKLLWCLEQPPLEFLFRGEICAVHTDEDPVTQQFQKNWSLGWCLDLTMFFILLFVDHSMISTHSLSKSTIDHSPSDLFGNSLNNSNMPSPLDDFHNSYTASLVWSHHHGLSCWTLLSIHQSPLPMLPNPLAFSPHSHWFPLAHDHSYWILHLICQHLFQSLCTMGQLLNPGFICWILLPRILSSYPLSCSYPITQVRLSIGIHSLTSIHMTIHLLVLLLSNPHSPTHNWTLLSIC